MKISPLLTDEAILAELGERLARRRIELELTQAEAADQAGLGKRTLERIEAGESTQISSLLRLLRVLELLPQLDQAIPAVTPGPMELLRNRGKMRQRAPGRRGTKAPERPWAWDKDA
ncbi:helix-turn-helix transcriptional regulator [Wenzhouxiangella sp. XN24]|uniref:helix-turn-helix transcriptional regulator n=1 Tax=Wenzhouxiangella sp. XN24 TaxID=2713569 RepID=UPI0013EC6E02|nr:helix-turn-helix transcriptional regulator [Wenzhouxiangella sp. XN24]NGX15577.1 helix-turn-helix transcriptional regulator [Wenzhouxiangella sp. XN24]